VHDSFWNHLGPGPHAFIWAFFFVHIKTFAFGPWTPFTYLGGMHPKGTHRTLIGGEGLSSLGGVFEDLTESKCSRMPDQSPNIVKSFKVVVLRTNAAWCFRDKRPNAFWMNVHCRAAHASSSSHCLFVSFDFGGGIFPFALNAPPFVPPNQTPSFLLCPLQRNHAL